MSVTVQLRIISRYVCGGIITALIGVRSCGKMVNRREVDDEKQIR